jgi:quercetin 2,3-dioxygenase
MKQTLPGTCEPYLLRDGEGERYLVAGQLATVLARPEDTAGLLEAAIVSGRRNSVFPLHAHRSGHEAIIVLDGLVELRLGSSVHALRPGDYASIPPGIPHGYEMKGPYSRLLAWTVNGSASRLLAALGDPVGSETSGPADPAALSVERRALGQSAADVEFLDDAAGASPAPAIPAPPADVAAYVLTAGDGERMLAGDQLFTFLSHQGNTGGAFITLSTVGPRGGPIPRHFHAQHTETFFCLSGRMTMWNGDEEVTLHPGDFLHVPAGTVHAYQLDAPLTRFVGLLAPGLFEPFFRTLCDPCEDDLFPVVPRPVRFDRVMQKINELDLKLVGPPRHG